MVRGVTMNEAELLEHIRKAWKIILLSCSQYGKITIDFVDGDSKHVAVQYNVLPDKYRLKEDVKKF